MPVTYIPIATTVASGAVASITFSSLSGYTDLLVKVYWRSGTGTYGGVIGIRPNNINTSTYNRVIVSGDGGTASTSTSTSSIACANLNANSASNLSDSFTHGVLYIPSYTRASSAHNLGFMSFAQNGTDNTLSYSMLSSNIMNPIAAITSLVFSNASGNIESGTRIDVYGISAT